MSHKPIFFQNVGLSFPQKTCFQGLTAQVQEGSRMALMGQNGSGKSTLLKMIQGTLEPSEGNIEVSSDIVFGYVPQTIEEFDSLSGGQRLHKSLTMALAQKPDILLLDEPTNHLDLKSRRTLMRMLQNYTGTLIIVSHDVELLRSCVDKLWHIENGKVHIFSGTYEDYIRENTIKKVTLAKEITLLDHQKKAAHQALMKEQTRAKKSKHRGEKHIEQRKWPTIVSKEKARRAVETSGKKKQAIAHQKHDVLEKLSEIKFPEVIKPKFHLATSDTSSKNVVSIQEGACGYKAPLLKEISLCVGPQDRLAIKGNNGSGKTTLIKAILADPKIIKSGNWRAPRAENIGYLDQHYRNLAPHKTVLETIQNLTPTWSHAEVRKHLNDFLFRKNEEVNAPVFTLSGGEKARLSLAQIAAKTPKLLILDEITNNLDLATREHVIQVIQNYPGALIIISHDEDFLKTIKFTDVFDINSL